jgi:tetratricopeptide (TPR) repeat protein
LKAVFHALLATSRFQISMYAQSEAEYRTALTVSEATRALPSEGMSKSSALVLLSYRGLMSSQIAIRGHSDPGIQGTIDEVVSSSDPALSKLGAAERLWAAAVKGESLKTSEMFKIEQELVSELDMQTATEPLWEDILLGVDRSRVLKQGTALIIMRAAQMTLAGSKSAENLALAKRTLMTAAERAPSMPGPFAILGRVFEMEADRVRDRNSNPAKLLDRAERCYRKCCRLDSRHPLGVRRLGVLLASRYKIDEALMVALDTVQKSPRCCWAWNLAGWAYLRMQNVAEAARSFQNAEREGGLDVHVTADACFGTGVGRVDEDADNDVSVIIDAWRGLSLAYMRQDRTSSSAACLDTALELIRLRQTPSNEAKSVKDLLTSYSEALTIEKALCLCRGGRTADALETLSMVSALAPQDAGHSLQIPWPRQQGSEHFAKPPAHSAVAEIYLAVSDESWTSGWFHRATRQRAIATLHHAQAAASLLDVNPRVNPYLCFARLGDSCRRGATENPRSLAQVVSKSTVRRLLNSACTAYSHSYHWRPWEANEIAEELAKAVCQSAGFNRDNVQARSGCRMLVETSDDVVSCAAALGGFGRLTEKANYIAAEKSLLTLAAMDKNTIDVARKVRVQACLSELEIAGGDCQTGSRWALDALQTDPGNWRAWHVLGLARESDGHATNWSTSVIRSTLDAFWEADRRGGGPVACASLARAMDRYALRSKGSPEMVKEAAAAVATGWRVRETVSNSCRELAQTCGQEIYDRARKSLQLYDKNATKVASKTAHQFPFLHEAAMVLRELQSTVSESSGQKVNH